MKPREFPAPEDIAAICLVLLMVMAGIVAVTQ
jgi:hypothetical protein